MNRNEWKFEIQYVFTAVNQQPGVVSDVDYT